MDALGALEDFVTDSSHRAQKPVAKDAFASKTHQNLLPKSSSANHIMVARKSTENLYNEVVVKEELKGGFNSGSIKH